MYKEYFGLTDTPFSIAPDPRYLYMSGQHREALAHLLYGFNSNGGFVLLTGEVGTGKTTVCRCLLEQIPENSAIAFIFNPKLSSIELLETICDEFGIQYPQGTTSAKAFVDLINAFLLEADSLNRRAVLIIDEAQNLSFDVLEQLRLLTNLETSHHKLLQIILLGQPELREKLAQPELLQLSQRIVARYHLGPLSKKDTGAYVKHRLAIAGMRRPLFPDNLLDKLYRHSGGVPRIINVLCDRALLGAYAQNKNTVNASTLSKAVREVAGEKKTQRNHKTTLAWSLSVLVIAVFGIVLASTYFHSTGVEDSPGLETSPAAVTELPGITSPPVPDMETDSVRIPELPSNPGTIQWPDNIPSHKSSRMAFKALFRKWGLDESKAIDSSECTFFRHDTYRCLRSAGSLKNLRELNRPAVLKVFDREGTKFYAALLSMGSKYASLVIAEQEISVDIRDIENQWLGDYFVLWKTPPEYKYALKPDSEGPAVQWLEQQLATIPGLNVSGPENTNTTLKDKLKGFQLAQGLVPDGIAGARTVIHINTFTDSTVPLLWEKMEQD